MTESCSTSMAAVTPLKSFPLYLLIVSSIFGKVIRASYILDACTILPQ